MAQEGFIFNPGPEKIISNYIQNIDVLLEADKGKAQNYVNRALKTLEQMSENPEALGEYHISVLLRLMKLIVYMMRF